MADIVIRGMKMPKSCLDCPIMVDRYDTDACALQSQEANEAFESWEDMRSNCPLVPLPEGHGRLGDLDALDRAFTDLRFNADGTLAHWDDRRNWCLHGEEIERLIGEAPAIAQAEGGLRNDS